MKSISALLIEEVDKKVIKKFKGNILEVEFYLEQVKTVFEQILNLPKYESVAALLSHIDNFNTLKLFQHFLIQSPLKVFFLNFFFLVSKIELFIYAYLI